jgi:hypothetical protein
MKKTFCILGLVFTLFKVIESLAFEFIPVLTTSETMAYKAGYTVGVLFILLAAIGYSYWAYKLFIDGPTDHSPVTT